MVKLRKVSAAFMLIVAGSLVTGGIMTLGCSTFGTVPKGKDLEKLKLSPRYDSESGKFTNRRPGIVEENLNKNFSSSDMLEWFRSREDGVPKISLPEVKPDFEDFGKNSPFPRVVWFGHSSILMSISGKVILIDPVFSDSASPFSFVVKRFQKAVIDLSGLPEIDYIVISHDHYDHLDMDTIKYFKTRRAEFIVPLGVGSHLRGWGITPERITELDWHRSVKKDKLEFTALPAQHFSGRGLFSRNSTLWASWRIRSGDFNMFFSGDSGYDIHFKEIGEKYGPFDIAFIETGQYNEKWKEVHLLPHEAAQAYFDLKAKRYFPIHWGMFELAFHKWYQPASDIAAESDSRGINLVTPMLGETIVINDTLRTGRWWFPLIGYARYHNGETTLRPGE